MICPLQLSNSKKVAVVDFVDFQRLRKHTWYLDGEGYVTRDDGDRTHLLHREIMGLKHGDPRVVDHRDHNRLNNRRSNLLVVAGKAENNQNMPARGGSSQHRGVSWRKDKEKWEAQAKLKGKRVHIGYYDTEEAAAKAAADWRAKNMEFSTDGGNA